MSRVSKFDVTQNRANGIYHPGEVVAGQVLIAARKDIPLHGIYLWVLGQADVSWSDRLDGRRTHFEYEVYIKDCLTLWGKEPSEDQPPSGPVVLPAGEYSLPFRYRLPSTLPSTYESPHACRGRVHYHLRARVDSPREPLEVCREFLIIAPLDLNAMPRASVSLINLIIVETVQLRKDRYVTCCCCCTSGPLTCALRLDRTGYVPGEDINVDAEIQNMSRKDVTGSYVTMQQIIHFHAQGARKTNTSDIFRISGGKIKPGDSALFHDIIHLPPLPPSRMDHCNLIDIDYLLTVGVMPVGMETSVEVSVYITIGTKPLTQFLPPPLRDIKPSYSRYNYHTGEIDDYYPDDYHKGRTQNVFTYYKLLYDPAEHTEHAQEVT